MTKEEILYEKTGMIYTEHPKVMEAMTEFADTHLKEQFDIYGVSQRSKLLMGFVDYIENKFDIYAYTPEVRDCVKKYLETLL